MNATRRAAENCWIDTAHGFVGGALYWPRNGQALGTAVLIVPGIAHEERSMSVGVAALAESLADQGLPALLIDLHGSSQSSGKLDTPDIGARWRDDILSAVRYLRAAGFEHLVVIGVRLGALFALDALADESLLGMVAWSPIVTGRRHLRELRVLQNTAQTQIETRNAGLAIGGFDIPAVVQAHIAALDLMKLDRLAPKHLLMLDSPGDLNADWRSRFAQTVAIEEYESHESEAWLFDGNDSPRLPLLAIRTATDWCRRLHDSNVADTVAGAKPLLNTSITFSHGARRVRETFLEIGPIGLAAVLSEPVDPNVRPGMTRVLMSTVGPGRTFTDFARDQASLGHVCVRFDFAGFGSSHRPTPAIGGELYTDSGRKDVAAVVEHLRRIGHERLALLGFCAGAWSMIQAGPMPTVKAVAAINVALYRQPDPTQAELSRLARRELVRSIPWLDRSRLFRRIAARLERTSSAKRQPVRWLEALWEAKVHVLLAYASDDPGLTYLRRQLERDMRFHPPLHRVSMKTYEGLGHLAVGPEARAHVFDDIADFFASVDRHAEQDQSANPRSIGTSSADSGLPAIAKAITANRPTTASPNSIWP